MAERIPHKEKPCPVCMGSAGARRLRRDTGASGEYSVAGSVCSCIGGRSPFAAAPAWILQNYISVSARFEPAAYKKEQEELLECENFETITELKSGSLRRTDFAESACWLRINGRYIPKELVILGGAEVTFNIMNRDTTPVIFVYATGDTVKIDLGVQASVQKIRELNAYFRSRYHIFPGQADGKKTEELRSIFREIYTDYLKEKEPRKESRVLADLIEDAGELRKKCIERMPSYLKKVDEKAWWNEKTRKKMQQWKKDRENTS